MARQGARDPQRSNTPGVALRTLRRWLGRPPRPRPDPAALAQGLLELAGSAEAGGPFDKRMTALCRTTTELLRCDRSSLFLLSEGYYRARFNHGNPPDIDAVFHEHRVRPDDALIAHAVSSRSFVIVNEALGSPLMNPATARGARIRAIAVAPLFAADGEATGFLTAEFNENPGSFSELDATLLLGAARLAALALESERTREAREREAREREAMENRVHTLERLEALGLLAGGVAHDFNNLLTVMMGGCEWLEERVEDDLRSAVSEMHDACERAASLTGQLLSFGRRKFLSPRLVDLDQIVRDMQPMLRRLTPEDIDIAIHPTPDLAAVLADPVELEKVLLNLVVNARDAMPRGGCITIETSNWELDAEYARRHPRVEPGAYVQLAVSDTGEGFDAGDAERVFEPFFSTKEPGVGSGLGLATVYGAVRQSGGHVWVYTEPGRGSSFKVYLPRAEGEPPSASEAAPPRLHEPGQETVLVVDDEPGVRNLTRRALEANGYRVLAAAGADEALRLVDAHAGSVDLLLTDVVMPGGSGPDLARELVRARPGLQVLYMSGYAGNAIVHRGVLDPGVELIAKPFSMAALLTRIRETLDKD